MFNGMGIVKEGTALDNNQLNAARGLKALYIEADLDRVDDVSLSIQLSGATSAAIGVSLTAGTMTYTDIFSDIPVPCDRQLFDIMGTSTIKRLIMDIDIVSGNTATLPIYPGVVLCKKNAPSSTVNTVISVKAPLTLTIENDTLNIGLDFIGLVAKPQENVGLISINGVGVDPQGNINIVSASDYIELNTSAEYPCRES